MAKRPTGKGLFGKRLLALTDALHFMHSAAEIVRRIRVQKDYMPDEEDFILLMKLCDDAQDLRLSVMHVHHCLHKRLKGEPEPPFA